MLPSARPFAAVLVAAVVAPLAPADDWPQWMGPNRDGDWKETGVLTKFPSGGPKKLWSVPIAGGYAGPAVADDKVFVFDYARAEGDAGNNPAKRSELVGKERLLCLDAKDGHEVWKFEYDCKYSVSYPAGPRCTPTVIGGKVYTLGAMGHLHCLDAGTGKPIWSKNFTADYKAETPIWGFAGHPLVFKNLLVCLVGGPDALLVAFDKDTGAEKWKALTPPSDGPGYGTPALIDAGGTTQLVFWHPKAVVGLNPSTGGSYWSVPLKPSYGMSIMAPRKEGDTLFTGGIGHAAVAIKLDPARPAATEAWRGQKNTSVYPVNSTPLIEDGVIYGVDQPVIGEDQDEGYTGAGSGTAFLVKNGDRYFLFAETGHLVIAKLTPKEYEEIDRAKLVEPTGEAFGRKVVWSHPAFARRCVFVRNDKEIACFSLASE
jgi:outer membrane protein assembly factor BamB